MTGNKKSRRWVEIGGGSSAVHRRPALVRCSLYFSDVLIAPNLVLRLPPMPLTAPMIASEIPAAIRPYSMAVAPDSSFRKRTKSLDMANPLLERRFDHASQELQLSKIDCSKATEITRRTNGATAQGSTRLCAGIESAANEPHRPARHLRYNGPCDQRS